MTVHKRSLPGLALATVASLAVQPALAAGNTSALRPALASGFGNLPANPNNGFTQTVFSNNFDSQKTGPVKNGWGKNQFTLLAGTSNMTVENKYANSRPNALEVKVLPGQSSFVNKFFTGSYATLRVGFTFSPGPRFTIGPGGYVGLESSETKAYAKTRTGRVELTLNPNGQLGVTYYDTSYDTTHQHFYAWSATGIILPSHGYNIALQQTFGKGGTIVVYVNGAKVINVKNINLGTLGTHLVDVGNLYASPDSKESGHLYFDDVTVATKPAT